MEKNVIYIIMNYIRNIIYLFFIICFTNHCYTVDHVYYSNLSPKSSYSKNNPKDKNDDSVQQTAEAVQIEQPDYFTGPADTFLARMAEERLLLYRIHQKWKSALAFFGSARIPENHEMFGIAEKLGKYALWLLGRCIRTGAGPSMMDAPCRGFSKFKKWLASKNINILDNIIAQGIRIQLEFEQGTNPYIDQSYKFAHFITRVEALISNIFGLVALPGGFGTMNEIFQVWARDLPIVLFDYDQYWTPIMQALRKSFKDAGLVLPDSKIEITDNIKDTITFFRGAKGSGKPTLESVQNSIADLTKNYLKLSYLPPSITVMGETQLKVHKEKLNQMINGLVSNDYNVRIANNSIYEQAYNKMRELEELDKFQSTLYQPQGLVDQIDKQNELSTNNMFNYNVLTTKNSQGHIVFPGGIEVLNSVFDLMTIIQTGKVPKRPIILIGKDFWEPIISICIKQATEKFDPALINPEKDSSIVKITDSVEEGLAHLRKNAYPYDKSAFKNGIRIIDVAA